MKTSDRNCLRNRLLYVGQLVDWPEVITEEKTLEECREKTKGCAAQRIHRTE